MNAPFRALVNLALPVGLTLLARLASAQEQPDAEAAAPDSASAGASTAMESGPAETGSAPAAEVATLRSDDEPVLAPAPDPLQQVLDGFHFGSYGRIVAASDLRGGTGRQTGIVSFAPRVDEDDTYAEIELRREDRIFGVDTRIVATVAYKGPLFQYDGDFSERIAIRNLFAEARHILTPGLTLWGGSRMVRGDDVYLMNFWPMDNLNMVGGGARYELDDDAELSVTVGMSRPNDPFQTQTALFPSRTGFTADTVFVLDRPRTVLAGRLTYWPLGRFEHNGLKTVLYGEQHWLGSGTRLRDDGTSEALPEDSGFVLGAQAGAYMSDSRTFVNLFFRYARGLGAYDPLGVPFTTGTVISTGRAEQIRLALSGNWEWNDNPDVGLGLQVGAWWQIFRDADPAIWNRSAVSEGAIALRPHIWFGQVAGLALDLSYQGMQSVMLDELTGSPEGGSVYKLGIMPFVSPWGRGTYTRPQIRLVYALSGRDQGARALLNSADPRSQRDIEHFLGVSVEWWFSSSSYAP